MGYEYERTTNFTHQSDRILYVSKNARWESMELCANAEEALVKLRGDHTNYTVEGVDDSEFEVHAIDDDGQLFVYRGKETVS